ncbi:hypothetical protein L0666_14465 [Octadecabacter sp. CECT 8868]|uniref:hypothetical protein n=1 Tax=Octadecabacter algicola TaxID=2909342 RepID=UPI001F2D5646|nr:hypothetical protein [Octadecabacter algicola]MCF2906196.1 hypothetical protein [Octadecabacter algicola]
MQRRKFLQGMMASAGATALPAPVIAKAAKATTAKVVPFHYGWACVYAQMNNGVSAADIERVFRISGADAQGLMDRMLMRGVIRPPGLDGRSHPTRAWEPWDKKSPAPASEDKAKAPDDAQDQAIGQKARKKFARMIDCMKAEPHYIQAA